MKTILSIVLVLLGTIVFSQENFPASWQGKWGGTLEVHNAAGKVQEIPMELHILPIENSANYTWALIYGEDKVAGLREYELITLDASKGRYLIDEKNSIRIEGNLLGGKFFQSFEVQRNTLITATEKVGEELVWEIISGSSIPVSTTGGEIVGGEEIPLVKTFSVKVVQRARLKRM